MNDAPTSPLGGGPALAPVAHPWETVTRQGVRSLHYYGMAVAHYHKASDGRWRGVTRDGRLMYAAREGHLRQLLKEAHR